MTSIAFRFAHQNLSVFKEYPQKHNSEERLAEQSAAQGSEVLNINGHGSSSNVADHPYTITCLDARLFHMTKEYVLSR